MRASESLRGRFASRRSPMHVGRCRGIVKLLRAFEDDVNVSVLALGFPALMLHPSAHEALRSPPLQVYLVFEACMKVRNDQDSVIPFSTHHAQVS